MMLRHPSVLSGIGREEGYSSTAFAHRGPVPAQGWGNRADRYSELRTAQTEIVIRPRKKVEMSAIGG